MNFSKIYFFIFFLTFSIFYSQENEIKYLTTNWYDIFVNGKPSIIDFEKGEILVSENEEYLLRQTRDKKNIEIIQREKNEFGQWQYIQQIWESDRPNNSLFDFNKLEIQASQLRMHPVTLSSWKKEFVFHKLKQTAKFISRFIVEFATVSYSSKRVCKSKYYTRLILSNEGVLEVNFYYHDMFDDYCRILKETAWDSQNDHRYLMSGSLREHLANEGVDVLENSFLQVGETMNNLQALLSSDESKIFINNGVYNVSDFEPFHDFDGAEQYHELTPINFISP